MKSRLVFWLAAAVLVLAQFQDHRWKVLEVFDWDGGGYYSYLPDYFLYGGPGRPDSLASLARASKPPGTRFPMQNMGIDPYPGGYVMTKYPLGVALGQLPWFAGAHGYARWHGDPPNGFSRPYQQAVMMAGLCYAILGLWVLRKLLRRYFPDHVVAWVLAAIALGTNLLAYATYEAAISHAVLFLWQVSLLYCTARWHESPRRRWAAGIGLFLGLAVLCRFTEALYVLVPLCWGLGTGRRPAALGRHAGQVLLAGGIAAAIVSLQFGYWHLRSGHWLIHVYQTEYFDFRHPHILLGLFSFRKGWLLYTPLMGLALLGTGWLRRWVPAALAPVLLLLPVLLYVTFSWWQWWYGGGFSARPLISAYPLLSLPLAALVATAAGRGGWRYTGLRTLLVAGIALNMWQTWQWNGGLIESIHETRELYFQRFFWRRFPEQPVGTTYRVRPVVTPSARTAC